MIFKFYNRNGKYFVGVNDTRPIIQADGGCANMFSYAKKYNGLWLSDEKLPGWHEGYIANGYFYGEYPGYGTVCSGAFQKEQAKVCGFKYGKQVWWRTGDKGYLLKEADWREYYSMTSPEAKKKFLADKFPEDKPVDVKKEPVAVAKDEEVPF